MNKEEYIAKKEKELKKKLLDIAEEMATYMDDKVDREITKAFNEPASLSITKNSDGTAETHVEGKSIPILIALAGLEKAVLEKLEVPSSLWEHIKERIGTREAE